MRACLEKPISYKEWKPQISLVSVFVQPVQTSKYYSYLVICFAILPNNLDPCQHVIAILGLKQVLAEILRGQPQGVFPLGFTVGNVNQAAADADWTMFNLTGSCSCPVNHCISLVFVKEEWMGAENGEGASPRSHTPTNFLSWRKMKRRHNLIKMYRLATETTWLARWNSFLHMTLEGVCHILKNLNI